MPARTMLPPLRYGPRGGGAGGGEMLRFTPHRFDMSPWWALADDAIG